MLAAALLIAMYPDWVPARWPSADVKSLELLANSPVNCLWLERAEWSAEFVAEATRRGIATLGVIHREGDPTGAARDLVKAGLTGGVLEGDFDDYSISIVSGTLAKAGRTFIESGGRARFRPDGDAASGAPILSTSQGMWPGIHVEKGGSATAGPTANPWIDTNTGFLRFARASTAATIWLAVRPPEKTVYPAERYEQAIGDAAMNGGRWVVALDDDLWRRILAREAKALKDWDRVSAALRHFEEHKEWRAAISAARLAMVESYEQARMSGGLFDMLAAKHVPVLSIPDSRIDAGSLRGVEIAVNPEPEKIGARATELLGAFGQDGKKVVEGPKPGPNGLRRGDGDFIFDPTDTRADATWRRVSEALGRQNVGVRLFNVASMLSNMQMLPAQRQAVLHLVNYSDYPASGITARVLGVYRRARLYRPGEQPVDLETEKVDGGTGFAIDQRITSIATVVLE